MGWQNKATGEAKEELKQKMVRVWAYWITAFLVAEGYAVYKGTGTLSHFIRRFFGVGSQEPLKYKMPRWVLILLCTVLGIHFIVD